MMIFGASGRQSFHQGCVIIAGSNWIRAAILADLVASEQLVIRRVVRGYGGQPETIREKNPAFENTIKRGCTYQHERLRRYTYEHDWIATLQAFRARLDADSGLCCLAECQGLTTDDVDDMIEQIQETIARKKRKGRRFDA